MAGPFFDPAQYVADQAVSPAEWSRQRAASMHGIGEFARDASKMRQQQQQFQSEQERLRMAEAERQREWEAGFQLDTARFGLATAAQALDEERLGFSREQEAHRMEAERVKRRDEGVATLVKAMQEAETVEEYNAVAEIAAKQYGIQLVPGGGAGTAPGNAAGAVPPHNEVAPVAFDEGADRQRQRGEAKAVESLPPGGGRTPAGQAVSRQITEGATQGAEARGLPTSLGVAPEGPKVSEAVQGLGKLGPMSRLDEEDRQRTDASVKESLLKRSQALKSMGLSPEQLQLAEFYNAQAHGIPMQEPQFAAPQADPNAPPQQMEVTLPDNVVQMAMAPPELPRSVVTEGREAGGFTMVDASTGEQLGTLDWNGIQEARREKRRQKVEPLIRMAQNPRDAAMFRAAADAYIEGGDEDAFKTLMSYENMLYSQTASFATQDRLVGNEAADKYTRAYQASGALAEKYQKREDIVEQNRTFKTIEQSLDMIGKGANPVEQGQLLANALAAAATRRATDKDFDRFVRMGLYEKMVQFKNYVIGGGEVDDNTLANLQEMLEGTRAWQETRKKEQALELYEQIRSDGMVQTFAPESAESLARQRVQELFPGATPIHIKHPRVPMIDARSETRDRRAAGSLSGPDAEERVKNLNPQNF